MEGQGPRETRLEVRSRPSSQQPLSGAAPGMRGENGADLGVQEGPLSRTQLPLHPNPRSDEVAGGEEVGRPLRDCLQGHRSARPTVQSGPATQPGSQGP